MLKNLSVEPWVGDYIKKKLIEIERINQIKIILAVESGSRAWGFPSIDSDYDVRFIYIRPPKDYLSVRDYADHIETPIVHDEMLGVPFDLNGWDLRKALKLSLKSNPVLIEWLVSPVSYIKDESSIQLLTFAKQMANLQKFLYHYDRLARSFWNQIQQGTGQVKTKLYCYVLRSVIAIKWVSQRNETPPMDMPTLCQGVITDDTLQREINNLIERKRGVKEVDLMLKNSVLDSFIISALQKEIEHFSITQADANYGLELADKIFYKFINSVE